nr:hypothetical protein [Tanacetum cinerariifolium]
MDATGGSGSIYPVWPIVDDNGAVDMDATMDNLKDRISNLKKVFAYLKNKKMLERNENKTNKEIIIILSDKSFDERPSSDDTTDENIAKFKVAAKSKGSTSKPEKGNFSSRMGVCFLYVEMILALEFTIYEMIKGCSVWSVWYFVNTEKLMNSLREGWSIRSTVLELRKSAMDNSFTFGSNEEADNVKISQSCNGLLLCSDSRLDSRKSTMDNSFGFAKEVDYVRILQSCNGLLLYASWAWLIFYYVHNPSTKLFERLSQPHYSLDDSRFYKSVVLRMAFDPRKLFDYKVVQAGCTYCNFEIQI